MAFDFSVTGNTKLDTSGFTQGISSMTVAAGTLIADLVKTAGSQLEELAQSAIQIGSAYEVSLAKVGTIADLGKLSIQQLSDQITATSNNMGIAATDIAEAAYQAISAGQDTSNAVAFAGQAAKLAAAGFTSTTSAVDILTTALNAYGLSANQATHVSDVLLTTQNLGKTSVNELSSSMGRVIPLAAAYSVSVENLSSALAVMTANGIATAEATTYTKSMLNELGDTGSTVGKILQSETGKSFAQLSADGKSLGDVLQILYDNVGGDSTAFAGLWSSVEAGTGALSLASGGADKFNGILAQMVDSAGATETAYETMTDTFQHSMESLQTTAENLSIRLFDAMEPGLKEAANWGTECLNILTESLTDGGPMAMLDAASTLLENLTAGIVQSIPKLASAATQSITQLVQYLADHQDEIFDAGIQLLEQLIIGITDNLPALITAAAELIAKFSAALISHLPNILNCGAALLTTLVDGIIRSIENLGEAALACIAKLTGIWDGSMDEWGHIGENIVRGLLNGIVGMWDKLVSSVKGMVTGMVNTVKGILGIHSPSKVFSEIGLNICRGLAAGLENGTPETEEAAKQIIASVTDTATQINNGITSLVETTTEILADETEQQKQVITSTGTEIIDGIKRTVKTVTTIAADGTKTVAKTIEDAGPQYASAAELLTTQFRQKLDDGWQQIESDIQTDALGAIETLAKAIQSGDLEQLGLWAAEYFWNACTDAQKQQINDLALGALNQLSSALSGVGTNLAALASSLVAKFVPAATTATGAQTALNVAMDANPIMLVISLIGMLVGALVNFASTNKEVAASVKNVWNGLADFMSIIFEGALRVVGLAIEGFILTINSLISAYNAIPGVEKIDKVKNPLWNGADKLAADRKQRQEERSAQGKLDAQYAADTSAAEKKQMEAQYAKKKAELEKAKLSSDDPGMLDAEKALAKADYEKDLADLKKKLIDAEYEKASAELAKKSTKDKAKLAELEKQILAADNTIQTGELEKELLKLDYEKTLKELESKYSKPSGSTDKPQEPGTDPSLPDNTDAIKDNTDALLAANEKLAEMVRQADSLVLSDNMAVTRTVAASGTAQVAAAANNYVREGDTTVVQNIYSKAQTAADLQREARWEADRAKAQKH